MEVLYFKDYTEIGKYMYDKANDGCNITATLFLEDTLELMRDLLSYEDVEIGGIDVAQMEYHGYSKEYYITLSDDLTLDIEPAWHINGYLSAEPDIMLIDGNASSAIVKDIPIDNCIEIYIGENPVDENDNNDDDDDELLDVIFDNAKIITENDKPIGISFNVTDILKYLFG